LCAVSPVIKYRAAVLCWLHEIDGSAIVVVVESVGTCVGSHSVPATVNSCIMKAGDPKPMLGGTCWKILNSKAHLP